MNRSHKSYIAERTANEIESKSVSNGTVYRFKPNKINKWNNGICLICGESFSFISSIHAKKCGFKSIDDMANSDKIRWI